MRVHLRSISPHYVIAAHLKKPEVDPTCKHLSLCRDAKLHVRGGDRTSETAVKNKQCFKYASTDDPERATRNCKPCERGQRQNVGAVCDTSVCPRQRFARDAQHAIAGVYLSNENEHTTSGGGKTDVDGLLS